MNNIGSYDVVLMGIDIGLYFVRTVAYTVNGERIASSKRELGVTTVGEERVEQSPVEVLGKVYDTLRVVLKRVKPEKAFIGLTGVSPSLLLLDKDMKPLDNIVLWMDQRGSEEAGIIARELGRRTVYEKTGLLPDPIHFLSKILWYKRNRVDLFYKTKYFVQVKDYVFYHLTGLKETDYTHASKTQLFNIGGYWDHEILDYVGLTEENLFKPVESHKIYEIPLNVRRELEAEDIELYVTQGSDNIVSSMTALGGIDSSVLVDITDNMLYITLATDKPAIDPGMYFEVYRHAVPGKYVVEACLPFGGLLLDIALRLAGSGGEISIDAIIGEELGPSKLLFLPFIGGTRSPDWTPWIRGVIYNLTVDTTLADLIKSVMEGVSFWIKNVVELLNKLGYKPRELRVCGSQIETSFWLQVKSDILNMPVRKPVEHSFNIPALGASIIAGYASGIYRSYVEAVEKTTMFREEFYPRIEVVKHYRRKYHEFMKLWSYVKKIARDIPMQ